MEPNRIRPRVPISVYKGCAGAQMLQNIPVKISVFFFCKLRYTIANNIKLVNLKREGLCQLGLSVLLSV